MKPCIHINGNRVIHAVEDGDCRLHHARQAGDTVTVEFDMPVRKLHAHPFVRDAAGKVALARGPLVYCVESADHEAALSAMILPDDAVVETKQASDDVLAGLTLLQADALVQSEPTELYSEESLRCKECRLTAAPYFAWGNRQPGNMRVWIRNA